MKKIAVLQVTPKVPNKEHVKLFKDKKHSDFYFVTHDEENKDSIGFLPNSDWAETRNLLYNNCPKKYEYYAFIDYDYKLVSKTNKNWLEQVIEDLENVKPAILCPYPGQGNLGGIYPKLEQGKFNNILFSHVGLKIVHHSLMDYFLPMIMKFGGGFSACHHWNILEIPFIRDIIMTHNVIYENTVSNSVSRHNKDKDNTKRMKDMYEWIKPYLKFESGIDYLDIKRYWANKSIKNNISIKDRKDKKNFLLEVNFDNFFKDDIYKIKN